MKYLHYTYVDAVTGISIEAEPAKNGPASPAIDGLVFSGRENPSIPRTCRTSSAPAPTTAL